MADPPLDLSSAMMANDVELAHRLAGMAHAISIGYFNHDPRVERKADGTRVSEADLAVGAALVGELSTHRPADCVLSEEGSPTTSRASRRWILDPIDGTDWFLAGGQSWGTHIALEVDGLLQFAVITRPTVRRRCGQARRRRLVEAVRLTHVDQCPTGCVWDRSTFGGTRRGLVRPESRIAEAIRTNAGWVADPLGDVIALKEPPGFA